jgi:hypothetical protein
MRAGDDNKLTEDEIWAELSYDIEIHHAEQSLLDEAQFELEQGDG